jgi:hypothetical protein
MRAEFAAYKLNKQGRASVRKLDRAFSELLTLIESMCVRGFGPAEIYDLARARLMEASFYAKKAMASMDENQEHSERPC